MGIKQVLRDMARPLNKKELAHLDKRLALNPYPPDDPQHATWVAPDPRTWVLPARGLPASYLSFLSWSRAGTYKAGQRTLQFLDPFGLREEMLTYFYPMSGPGVIPFAKIPGNPARYCFDTSDEPVDGEFPIVLHLGGGTMWERMPLAKTFVEFCKGSKKDDTKAYWGWWEKYHNARK
jgi:hypothetical protein